MQFVFAVRVCKPFNIITLYQVQVQVRIRKRLLRKHNAVDLESKLNRGLSKWPFLMMKYLEHTRIIHKCPSCLMGRLDLHRNSHGSRRPPSSLAFLYIPCICRHHAAGKTYIPLKFVKRNKNLFFHKRDNGIWRLAAALRRHINGIYKNAYILIPIFRIQSHSTQPQKS